MALLSDITLTTPTDASAASGLASALRELKSQLVSYLGVSLEDDGTLKVGSLSNNTMLGDGVIGSAQIGNSVIQEQHIAPDQINSAHLQDGAVLAAAIGTGAVTADKIGSSAVETAKIAALAVDSTKLAASAVTNDKIATGTIASDKLASVDGSKLVQGSVTADRLKYDAAYTTPRLAVVGTSSGTTKFASIGGAVSATLVGDVLTFTMGSGVTDNSIVAEVAQTASGTLTASSYTSRASYSRLSGEAILKITGGDIEMVKAGAYLVLFWAAGYSCGLHKVVLTDNAGSPTIYITGGVAYAGVGEQTLAFGCGLLNVAAAGAKYRLRHWCSLTRSTDGQGRAVGDGSSEYYAGLTFIGLS